MMMVMVSVNFNIGYLLRSGLSKSPAIYSSGSRSNVYADAAPSSKQALCSHLSQDEGSKEAK